MKKITLGLVVFLLLFPGAVSAAKCTTEQVDWYKKLAGHIQTTYDYVENDDGSASFEIKFHNVHDDLYISDYKTFDSIYTYKTRENGVVSSVYYPAGGTYTLSVLNFNNVCNTSIISTIKVSLPYYNKYYKRAECQGIETYSLCQKWNNTSNITEEEFVKKITEYKKQSENNDISDEIEKLTFLQKIWNFIVKYYLIIVLVICLAVGAVIFIIHKKNKEKF